MPRISGVKVPREVYAQLDYSTVATVAAGGQATIDSPQISANRRGRLLGIIVTSSVPFKAEVRTVEAGIPSATRIPWFAISRGWEWRTVEPDLITISYSGTGLDAFRVVVTNLDTSQAADVYATFFYDEV